jgi:hypothetical protein
MALGVGSRSNDPSAETITLAVPSAVAFAVIDLVFFSVEFDYLADAAVQLALAAMIIVGPPKRRRRESRFPSQSNGGC